MGECIASYSCASPYVCHKLAALDTLHDYAMLLRTHRLSTLALRDSLVSLHEAMDKIMVKRQNNALSGCRKRKQYAMDEAREQIEAVAKQLPSFHALPLPKTTYQPPPVHASHSVHTMPKPFYLRSEKRHEEVQFWPC